MTAAERWEELGHSPERHTPAVLSLAEAVDDVVSYFSNIKAPDTVAYEWAIESLRDAALAVLVER